MLSLRCNSVATVFLQVAFSSDYQQSSSTYVRETWVYLPGLYARRHRTSGRSCNIHLGMSFIGFTSVFKQILRWFQIAAACFWRSSRNANSSKSSVAVEATRIIFTYYPVEINSENQNPAILISCLHCDCPLSQGRADEVSKHQNKKTMFFVSFSK